MNNDITNIELTDNNNNSDETIKTIKKTVLKLMQLDKYELQNLLKVIRDKTGIVHKELSEINIDNITLNDLINYENNLKQTITLTEDLYTCFMLLNNLTEQYNTIQKEHMSIEELTNTIYYINDLMDEKDFKYLTDSSFRKKPYIIAPYIKENSTQ